MSVQLYEYELKGILYGGPLATGLYERFQVAWPAAAAPTTTW